MSKLNRTIGKRPRNAMLGAAFATVALGVAACSPSGVMGSQSGMSSKSAEPPKIAMGDYFVHPTDIEVPGLNGQLTVSSTGTEGRWSYLPGQQPFNVYLADTVGKHLVAQAASRDAAYTPEAHDPNAELLNRGCVSGSTKLSGREILDNPELAPEPGTDTKLAITCDTVLASGANYGQMLRFVRGNATEVVSDSVEIIYTNTETGEVAKGRDLLNSASLPVLYDALFELRKIEPPMSGDQVIAPSEETLAEFQASLSNISFGDNGDIYVTVDPTFIAVAAAGDPNVVVEPTTLVIPAQRAEEMLTPLGASISQSQAASTPWSGPAPVPSGKDFVDCDLVPCVAVTYDDGPSYLTPQVLDVYADRDYAATTFFILGQNIAGNEEILKRAAEEGHELANHSWTHAAFTTLSDEGVAGEISQTNQKILEVTGVAVKNHRPPYGDLNERTLAAGGMPAILWSVDTNDWQKPGHDALINEAVYNATPDGIVLMHDIHEETVAVAGEVADLLLQRGFTLVTIDQLFGGLELPSNFFYSAEGIRQGS